MDERQSYAPPTPLGGVMPGESVTTVVASRNSSYSEGDIVLAHTGWCTHALSDRADLRKLDPTVAPVTTALGVLGMPGFTAYGGLRLIGKPAPGETVVVAAASGPVGSMVGQLARISGAKVIEIAGGNEKCRYVKDELGFDAVVDHRASDFAAQLAAACPKGIDVYFENVGGTVWQAVLPLLNNFARIPVCGLIAQYNASGPVEGIDHLPATMRGKTLIEKRGHLSEQELDSFTAAGFTKEQVLEVIAIVAASTITNYAGTIASPPLEDTFRQHAWQG